MTDIIVVVIGRWNMLFVDIVTCIGRGVRDGGGLSLLFGEMGMVGFLFFCHFSCFVSCVDVWEYSYSCVSTC